MDELEGYDVMQVCLNGHQITSQAEAAPQFRKSFCPNCGERTVTACPECEAPIQGFYHIPGVFRASERDVPKFCHACGYPYPWRVAEIANLVEILQSELDEKDAAEMARIVPHVTNDTPLTESSALKLKRLMDKLGKPTYDVAVKVVSDLASETVKKVMGLK